METSPVSLNQASPNSNLGKISTIKSSLACPKLNETIGTSINSFINSIDFDNLYPKNGN
jgi:hypothetical protein